MSENRPTNGRHDQPPLYSIPDLPKIPKFSEYLEGRTKHKGPRTFGRNCDGTANHTYLNIDGSIDDTQRMGAGRGEENGMGEDYFPPYHMTAETHKAIEAVRFIAAHLRNEDEYGEVSPFQALVVIVIIIIIVVVVVLVVAVS